MVRLPKERPIVLQADDPKYKRGLVVTLKDKGGYDLYYWYNDPKKIYPAEIKVDGRSVKKDGKIVHVGFHPELGNIDAELDNKKTSNLTALGIIAGLILLEGKLK